MKIHSVKPLLKRGLFNAGLVELSPTMLVRYNDALVSLGLEPTRRKRVLVDGVGWSPQIARERRNPYYMCSGGLVNPVAIIVSPDQYKKPVYWPIFSWMRGAMRLVFEKYHREIIDITGTHVISLDCENGLSTLEGPKDLLLLSEVTLKPNTGRLVEAAQEQAALVNRFMDGLHCLESETRNSLIAHRRAHSDLRKRRVSMQPVTFDFFNDFYTVAFGGVAVLRDVDGSDLLVMESQSDYEAIKGSDTNAVICYLYDQGAETTGYLANAGFLRIPYEEYRSDPALLERKKDLLLAYALCDCEEGLDWSATSPAKRKTLIKKHGAKVPHLYAELERFAAAVRRGSKSVELSRELWHYLAVPSDSIAPATKEVLWILLTRLEPRRLLNLYRYDKNKFFEVYSGWSGAKQEWVADYIQARYEPRMNS